MDSRALKRALVTTGMKFGGITGTQNTSGARITALK
jgi:hypothetical protein